MLQPDQQQELLDEVVEDFTARLRSGQHPAIQEYANQYPSLAEDIEELLTSVAMIEELKKQGNSVSDSLKSEMKQILKLERIGDYRIVRELGRGGMGIVFEAVHESLGRRVAIKVMPNRKFDDPKYLERFKREAQAAANLHHTNIVSVFGIGQTGEHHYYVMEFVDGQSLSSILADLNGMNETQTEDKKNSETYPGPLNSAGPTSSAINQLNKVRPTDLFESPRQRFRWAAHVGLQISEGLAYAHILGTLHRDIKPSNLLVDKNKTVWLTDFGLVKNISNQTITKTGDIVGTPQYMSPESFEGQYDERSETYCLGLTLYELITLKPAFENASTPELIRQITTTSPPVPRKIDPRIPRDLNRIVQKAISREPSYRYQTADEMGDDLRAYLEDRPISARKISMTENLYRWSIRNPLSACLALSTALMICAIAVGATALLRTTNQALQESRNQADMAEHQNRLFRYMKGEAEKTTNFTVEAFDEMFRGLVFRGQSSSEDFSLDGFNNIQVSNTITESDAEFLDKMLQFFQRFAENNKDNFTLQKSTAKSIRRVANIYHLTGQFDEAAKAYEESISSYNNLRIESPNSVPMALELAKTTNELGRVIELQGRITGRKMALARFRKSEEMLRNHSHSEDPLIQLELAKTLILFGSPYATFRASLPERFDEIRQHVPRTWFSQSSKLASRVDISERESAIAIKRLREAIRIAQRYTTFNIDNSSDSVAEATGDTVAKTKRTENSPRLRKQELVEKEMHAEVIRNEAKFISAMATTRLAIAQLRTRDFFTGRKTLIAAETKLFQLEKQDPNNPKFQFVLAQLYAMPKSNTLKAKIGALKKSRNVLRSMTNKFVGNLDYKRAYADTCFRLGMVCLEDNQLDEALTNLKLANVAFQSIVPLTPRNYKIQANGFSCHLHLIDLLLQSESYDDAVTIVEKSLARLRKGKGKQKSRPFMNLYNRRSAFLQFSLAVVYEETGDQDASDEARGKMMDSLNRIPTKKISRPRNRSTRLQLQ